MEEVLRLVVGRLRVTAAGGGGRGRHAGSSAHARAAAGQVGGPARGVQLALVGQRRTGRRNWKHSEKRSQPRISELKLVSGSRLPMLDTANYVGVKMERDDDTYRYHSNQDLLENAPRTSRNAARTAAASAAAASRSAAAADLFRGEEGQVK